MSSVGFFFSYVYYDVDALNEFTDFLELLARSGFLL